MIIAVAYLPKICCLYSLRNYVIGIMFTTLIIYVTKNKSMKTTKIIYWISSGLLALFILPGIFFMNSQMAIDGMKHFGLPDWFRIEVSIGSFIGGLILIIPFFGKKIKEWNYVALGIVYISALIAHCSVDGFIGSSFEPLVTFALLLTSYICYHKINGE